MSKILNISIKTQEKTVTPSNEIQEITADEGYTCLSKVIVEAQSGVPAPTKSWLYITEWDSNGYPIKAKTIGCSGGMPDYMYGCYDSRRNVLTSYLQEFEINEGVTGISEYAFASCRYLTSVKLPDSIKNIYSFAFQYSSKLVSINIPYGVDIIKQRCFRGCSSLTSIIIPDSVIYTELECFLNCSKLANIKLSSNLKEIASASFEGCSSLTNLVMPSSLTSIGSSAFWSCSKLALFDFRGATQVPTLSSTSAFNRTPSTKKIVVPDSLYDSWITATNWSSSDNNIVSSIIKASDYEASL